MHLMQTIIDLPPEQVLLEGSNPYLPALAVTALREALAQPEQKPVAYDYHTKYDRGCYKCRSQFCPGNCIDTAPPKRPWVGLTDDEVEDCMEMSIQKTCRAVEAKLKEKNT